MNIAWRTIGLPLILIGLALASLSAPRAQPVAAAMPAPSAPAQAACPPNCTVFLPAVAVPGVLPILFQPANQAQVDSIAPTLYWTPAITGTYLIQMGSSPEFTSQTNEISTTRKLNDLTPQFTVPRNNLNGETKYYWRVGVLQPEGMVFSPVWEFTTAVEDPSRLPPPPQLLSPANGARLTTLTPDLTWAAPDGVDAYRARVLLADGKTTFKTSSVIEMPKTSYSPSGLAGKVVYYWQVRVHNSYGWGQYGTGDGQPWRFRTP
jgi:hypothetical protein